jgi:UDP-2,3-diacylglucosamine pyrophosphatase LpxH
VNPSVPLFFMADSHAGIRGDQGEAAKLQAFAELLARVEARTGELWILGDLFDFWFEWRHVVPKRAFPWLTRLRACVDRGCAIHLLPGNHDFRLRGFLEQQVGLVVHDEPCRRALPGLTVAMHHGDGLDPRERGYLLLRALIRNPIAYGLFTALHPDWGMALADRSGSRDRSHRWDVQQILDYLQVAGPRVLQPGDGLLLLGHAHRCVCYTVGQVPCVVLPPFIHRARGYLCLENGVLVEHYLHPEHREPAGPPEGLPGGQLVLTKANTGGA